MQKTNIEQSDGYKKLLASVERDEEREAGFHDYRAKLKWVLDRAAHYAEKTGIESAEILNSWEKDRDYWYMNYYQDCNQPEIKSDNVRVFGTIEELKMSIGDSGFRCPKCGNVSTDPYECTFDGCDWKSYGLFKTLGKGVSVFVKEKIRVENFFMPVAWEGEYAENKH